MSDTRSQIGDALRDHLTPEQLSTLMDDVLAIRKQTHAEIVCKHCGRAGKYLAEIPDPKAVTGALVDLANQAWGRPQDDKVEAGNITFVRKTVFGGSKEAE